MSTPALLTLEQLQKPDPNWLNPGTWKDAAQTADRLSSDEVTAALNALGSVFDTNWARDQSLHHRVVGMQYSSVGRVSLLELGRALAAVPNEFREEVAGRLREADQFFGAAGEVLAALMITQAGGVVHRRTSGVGPRIAEFVARWEPDSEAIVEVKTVDLSDAVRRAEVVVIHAYAALMQFTNQLPARCATILWDSAILHHPPDEMAITAAIRAAVAKAVGIDPSKAEALEIRGVGTIELVHDPTAVALRVKCGTFAPSDGEIYRHLRRRANTALQQIGSHPDLPGIIVLDVDANGLARNGLTKLSRWTQEKSQLGAVVTIERERNGGCSYGNVSVLPGQRFAEVSNILNAFEVCEMGHIHYQPLSTPSLPCGALFGIVSRFT